MKNDMTTLPPLTDQSIFHYGNKYRGKKMSEVPASYFIFIFENNYTMSELIKNYIKDNMAALKIEAKKEKKEAYRDWKNSAR